jgi:hypothetical protein
MTDKLSATTQIAKRVYSLAEEQNNSALMIGAYRALAVPLYFLGDFESSRDYAMRGVQLWHSSGVQSPVEEVTAPAVTCLIFEALSEWHFGEIVTCQATIAEGIALAKELNDMHGLGVALYFAGSLGHFEGDSLQVEHLASDLLELSTRQNFALWRAAGAVLRRRARSASGGLAEGIAWIEDGIRDYRVTGSMLFVPYWLALKAEALHLADRTSEALEIINEAEALVERFEGRWWSAEMQRLRGVFLALSVPTRRELRLHSAKPSESQRSRSPFR